ncbi:multicopper oxidase [Vibrio vulnificus]|nr:multicopper oxidase [Vibrio vulnificus MO6-24/O]ANN27947.1 Multicopper oxidase [Vibrio vulnificus]OJH74889.1 hypothetical protein VVS222_02844 [Vibrio vulnificus]SUP29361.1 multicopper oxidase [Vibrio vulnificus]
MDISRRHFLQTSLAFSALTLLPAVHFRVEHRFIMGGLSMR